MSMHRNRARGLALSLTALLVAGAGPALAGGPPPPVGGCYLGTFSGWHSGTVTAFRFDPIEGPITDPSIKIPFSGSGIETGGEFGAIWSGVPGNAAQPSGYQMVGKHFYGTGTFFSGTLNEPENVLLSGKSSKDGGTLKLKFTTQNRDVIVFNLSRNTSAGITIDPPNPTVAPDGTITLTATVTGTTSQVVRWSLPGATFGGTFENEEDPPADNQVTFHAGFTEQVTVEIRATSVENGCAVASAFVTVMFPPQ